MKPIIRLASRVILRLVSLALIYIGVAEVHVMEFVDDPEVWALVTLTVSEAFFALDKAWDWLKAKWREWLKSKRRE
jgi:hypothetical protein